MIGYFLIVSLLALFWGYYLWQSTRHRCVECRWREVTYCRRYHEYLSTTGGYDPFDSEWDYVRLDNCIYSGKNKK